MNAIKSLILITFIGISSSITAQTGDWQIGGGGSADRIYRETSRGTRMPQSSTTWGSDDNQANVGIVIGYVNKQWTSDYGDAKQNENLFGEKDKRLHGLQIGFLARPTFNPIVGIHTGFFYERYFSSNDKVKETGLDTFSEHNIYIPAHLLINIPFSRSASLSMHGGIGFQWAIYGEYREYENRFNTYYDYDGDKHYDGPRMYQKYGNGWPRHVNWQAEYGIDLRIKMLHLGFTYSYGLTNHHLYNADFDRQAIKSRQDKMAFNIGIVF